MIGPNTNPARQPQPHPTVTRGDVERIVRRDFPADREPEILAMLNEYGTEDWHREPDRVHLAILKRPSPHRSH
jgi:hypothetical protein